MTMRMMRIRISDGDDDDHSVGDDSDGNDDDDRNGKKAGNAAICEYEKLR